MRITLFILFMFFGLYSFAQSVKITPKGFVDNNDRTKKYVIIDFPGMSKEKLFIETIKFINANYDRPEEITNIIQHEQIVITDFELIKVNGGFTVGSYDLRYFYKYDLQFRDGKLRFEPKFEYLKHLTSDEPISLIGDKLIFQSASGLYDRKEKVINEKMIEAVDAKTNQFIQLLKEKINTSQDSNWL